MTPRKLSNLRTRFCSVCISRIACRLAEGDSCAIWFSIVTQTMDLGLFFELSTSSSSFVGCTEFFLSPVAVAVLSTTLFRLIVLHRDLSLSKSWSTRSSVSIWDRWYSLIFRLESSFSLNNITCTQILSQIHIVYNWNLMNKRRCVNEFLNFIPLVLSWNQNWRR